MMADRTDVSLDSVLNNNNFDFIHKMSTIEDDLYSRTNNFNVEQSSPYNDSSFVCNYTDESEYCTKFSNNNNVTLCSLNIQSLSAKFSEFSDFIFNLLSSNSAPEIICLQEIWHIPAPHYFALPSYHPLLFKLRHKT